MSRQPAMHISDGDLLLVGQMGWVTSPSHGADRAVGTPEAYEKESSVASAQYANALLSSLCREVAVSGPYAALLARLRERHAEIRQHLEGINVGAANAARGYSASMTVSTHGQGSGGSAIYNNNIQANTSNSASLSGSHGAKPGAGPGMGDSTQFLDVVLSMMQSFTMSAGGGEADGGVLLAQAIHFTRGAIRSLYANVSVEGSSFMDAGTAATLLKHFGPLSLSAMFGRVLEDESSPTHKNNSSSNSEKSLSSRVGQILIMFQESVALCSAIALRTQNLELYLLLLNEMVEVQQKHTELNMFQQEIAEGTREPLERMWSPLVSQLVGTLSIDPSRFDSPLMAMRVVPLTQKMEGFGGLLAASMGGNPLFPRGRGGRGVASTPMAPHSMTPQSGVGGTLYDDGGLAVSAGGASWGVGAVRHYPLFGETDVVFAASMSGGRQTAGTPFTVSFGWRKAVGGTSGRGSIVGDVSAPPTPTGSRPSEIAPLNPQAILSSQSLPSNSSIRSSDSEVMMVYNGATHVGFVSGATGSGAGPASANPPSPLVKVSRAGGLRGGSSPQHYFTTQTPQATGFSSCLLAVNASGGGGAATSPSKDPTPNPTPRGDGALSAAFPQPSLTATSKGHGPMRVHFVLRGANELAMHCFNSVSGGGSVGLTNVPGAFVPPPTPFLEVVVKDPRRVLRSRKMLAGCGTKHLGGLSQVMYVDLCVAGLREVFLPSSTTTSAGNIISTSNHLGTIRSGGSDCARCTVHDAAASPATLCVVSQLQKSVCDARAGAGGTAHTVRTLNLGEVADANSSSVFILERCVRKDLSASFQRGSLAGGLQIPTLTSGLLFNSAYTDSTSAASATVTTTNGNKDGGLTIGNFTLPRTDDALEQGALTIEMWVLPQLFNISIPGTSAPAESGQPPSGGIAAATHQLFTYGSKHTEEIFLEIATQPVGPVAGAAASNDANGLDKGGGRKGAFRISGGSRTPRFGVVAAQFETNDITAFLEWSSGAGGTAGSARWVHLALVYSVSRWQLLINGQLVAEVASQKNPSAISTSAAAADVGGASDASHGLGLVSDGFGSDDESDDDGFREAFRQQQQQSSVGMEPDLLVSPLAVHSAMGSIQPRPGQPRNCTLGKCFAGCLSEVRVWGRARTTHEIARDMRRQLDCPSGISSGDGTVSHGDLLGYFPLDEQDGLAVTDCSGHGGHTLLVSSAVVALDMVKEQRGAKNSTSVAPEGTVITSMGVDSGTFSGPTRTITTSAAASSAAGAPSVSTAVTTLGGPCWTPLTEPLPVVMTPGPRFVDDFLPAVWASNSARDVKTALYYLPTEDLSGRQILVFAMAVPVDSSRIVVFEYASATVLDSDHSPASGEASRLPFGRMVLFQETIFEAPTPSSVFLSLAYRTDSPFPSQAVDSTTPSPTSGRVGSTQIRQYPISAYLTAIFYSEKVDKLLVGGLSGGNQQQSSTSDDGHGDADGSPPVRCVSVVPLRRVTAEEGTLLAAMMASRSPSSSSPSFSPWSVLAVLGLCAQRVLRIVNASSSAGSGSSSSAAGGGRGIVDLDVVGKLLPPLLFRPSGESLHRLCTLLRLLRSLSQSSPVSRPQEMLEVIDNAIANAMRILCLNVRGFALEARRVRPASNTASSFLPSAQQRVLLSNGGVRVDPSSTNFYLDGGIGFAADRALAFACPSEDATQFVSRIRNTPTADLLVNFPQSDGAPFSPIRVLEWLSFVPAAVPASVAQRDPLAAQRHAVLQSTLLQESLQLLLTDKSTLAYVTNRHRSGGGGGGAFSMSLSNTTNGGGNPLLSEEDSSAPEVVLYLAAISYFSDHRRLAAVPVERVLGLGSALLAECAQTLNRLWSVIQLPSTAATAPPPLLSYRICDLTVKCIGTAQNVLMAHLATYLEAGFPVPPLKLPSAAALGQVPMSPASPMPASASGSVFPPTSGGVGGGGALGNVANPAVAVATFILSLLKAIDGLVTTLTSALKKVHPNSAATTHSALLSEMHYLLTRGLIGSLLPMLFVILPTLPLPILGAAVKPLCSLRDSAVGLLEAAAAVTRGGLSGGGSNDNDILAASTSSGKSSGNTTFFSVKRSHFRALLQPVADFIGSLTLVWTQVSCALMLPPGPRVGGVGFSTASHQQQQLLVNHKPLGYPHDRLFRGGIQKKGTARDAALKSLMQGVGAISRVFNEVQSEHAGLRAGDKSLLHLERLIMTGLCSALLPTASLLTPTRQEMSALFDHVKMMRPWVLSERQKAPTAFPELIEKKVQLLCTFEPCIVDSRWSSVLSSGGAAAETAAAENKPNSVRLLEMANGTTAGKISASSPSAKETSRKWRKTFTAWKAFRQLRSLVAILQGDKSLGEAEAAQLVAKYLNDSSFTPARVEAQLLSTSHLASQKLVGLLGVRQLLQEHKHGRRISSATLSLLVRSFCGWHYQQFIEGCPTETVARVRGTVFQLVDEVVKEASKGVLRGTTAGAAENSPTAEGGEPANTVPPIPMPPRNVNAPAAGSVPPLARPRPPNILVSQKQHQQQSRAPAVGTTAAPAGGNSLSWLELALAVISAPFEVADFAKLPVAAIPQLLINNCKDDDTIARPRLNHSFPSTYSSARIPPEHTAHSVVLGPSGLVARGTGLRGCCVLPSLWDPQFHEQQQLMERDRKAAPSSSSSSSSSLPIVPLPTIAYYEVTIVDLSANASVGIGVGPSDYNLSRPPGWDPKSFALHDDGVLFAEGSTGRQINVTIGLGDVIGCGFDRTKRILFFTKNGRELGVTVELRPDVTSVCPLFGFDAKGLVKLNFGAEPFAYQLPSSFGGPGGNNGVAQQLLAPPRSLPQRCWDTFRVYAYRVCTAFSTVASLHLSQPDRSAEGIENDVAVEVAMQHVLSSLSAMLSVACAAGSAERVLAISSVAGHILSSFPVVTMPSSASSPAVAPKGGYRIRMETVSQVATIAGRLLSVAGTFAQTPPSSQYGDNLFAPVLTALKSVEIALGVVSPAMLRGVGGSAAATQPSPLLSAVTTLASIADRAFEGTASRQAIGWWIVGILRRINNPLPPTSGANGPSLSADGNDNDTAGGDESLASQVLQPRWAHPWAAEVHAFIIRRLTEGSAVLPSGTRGNRGASALVQQQYSATSALLLLPLAILGAGVSPIPLPGDAVLRRPKLYQCGQVLSYLLEDEVVTVLSSEGEDAAAAMVGFDYTGNAGGTNSVRFTMSTARVKVMGTNLADGGYSTAMAFVPATTADIVTPSVPDRSPQAMAERRRRLTCASDGGGSQSPSASPAIVAPTLDVANCPNHLEQIAMVISVARRMWLAPAINAAREHSAGPTSALNLSASINGSGPRRGSAHQQNQSQAPSPEPSSAPIPSPPHSPSSSAGQVATAGEAYLNARLLHALWVIVQSFHGYQRQEGRRGLASEESTVEPAEASLHAARVSSVMDMLLAPPTPGSTPLVVQLCTAFCHYLPERNLTSLLEDHAIVHAVLQELAAPSVPSATVPVSEGLSQANRRQSSAPTSSLGSLIGGGGPIRPPLSITSAIPAQQQQNGGVGTPFLSHATVVPGSGPANQGVATNMSSTSSHPLPPLAPPGPITSGGNIAGGGGTVTTPPPPPPDEATRVQMAQELSMRGFPFELCVAALEASGYVYSTALQWIMAQSDSGSLPQHHQPHSLPTMGLGVLGAGAFDFGAYEEDEGGLNDAEGDEGGAGEEGEEGEEAEEAEDNEGGDGDDDGEQVFGDDGDADNEDANEEGEEDGDDEHGAASSVSSRNSTAYDGFSLKGGSYISVSADTPLGPQYSVDIWLKCDTVDSDQIVMCEMRAPVCVEETLDADGNLISTPTHTMWFTIQGSVARFGLWDAMHPDVTAVFSSIPSSPPSPTGPTPSGSVPHPTLKPHAFSGQICEVPIGTAELGRWTRYTCTQDGADFALYKNGHLKSTATTHATGFLGNLLGNALCIGGSPTFPERSFSGEMKAVRIYDTALPKVTVSALQGVGSTSALFNTHAARAEDSLAVHFKCDEGKLPLRNAAVSASSIACQVQVIGDLQWASVTEEGLASDNAAVTLPEIDFTTHGEDEVPYTVDATSLDAAPSVLYRQLKKMPLTAVAARLTQTSQEIAALFAARVAASCILLSKGPLISTAAVAGGGGEGSSTDDYSKGPREGMNTPPPQRRPATAEGARSGAATTLGASPPPLSVLLAALTQRNQLKPLVRTIVASNDIHLVGLLQQLLVELLGMPLDGADVGCATSPASPPHGAVGSSSSPVLKAINDILAELLDLVNRPQSIQSFESSHPCRSLNDPPREVSFPKQRFYDIFFDHRGAGGNVLATFYADQTLANIVAQHSGYAFRIKAPKFIFDVRMDGAVGPLWGYRINVVHSSHQQLIAAKLLRTIISEVTTASVFAAASTVATVATAGGQAVVGGGPSSLTMSPALSPASVHQRLFAMASETSMGSSNSSTAASQPTMAAAIAPTLFSTATVNCLINATRINVSRARRVISGNLVKLLRFPTSFLVTQSLGAASVSSTPTAAMPLLLPDFAPLNEVRRQLDKQFRKELGLSIHSRFVQCIARLMLAVRDASLCWSEEVARRAAILANPPQLTLPPSSTATGGASSSTTTPTKRRKDKGGADEGSSSSPPAITIFGGGDAAAAVGAIGGSTLLDLSAPPAMLAEDEQGDGDRFKERRTLQKSLYEGRITDGHERLEVQRRSLPDRVRVEPNTDKTTSVWCEQAGGAVSANVAVGGGKWYFEVKLISSGDVAIGVAATVGSEARLQLWGLNGKYGLITTPGNQRSVSGPGGPQQRLWKSKDVVGVIIDADKRQLRYQVNGLDIPYVVDYGGPIKRRRHRQPLQQGDGERRHRRRRDRQRDANNNDSELDDIVDSSDELSRSSSSSSSSSTTSSTASSTGSAPSPPERNLGMDDNNPDVEINLPVGGGASVNSPSSLPPINTAGVARDPSHQQPPSPRLNPFREFSRALGQQRENQTRRRSYGLGGDTDSYDSAFEEDEDDDDDYYQSMMFGGNRGGGRSSSAASADFLAPFQHSNPLQRLLAMSTAGGTGRTPGGGGGGSGGHQSTSAAIDAIMESIFASTLLQHRGMGRGIGGGARQPGGGGAIGPFGGAPEGPNLDALLGGRGGIRSALDLAFGSQSGGQAIGGNGLHSNSRLFGGGVGGFGSAANSRPGGNDPAPSSALFPIPRVEEEGSDGNAGFTPWLVLGTDECVVINFGSRHFDYEVPHGALPLDPTNLGVGSLIPFNQLRAFDDVAASFALAAAPPPFFAEEGDVATDTPLNREGPSHVSLVGPPDLIASPSELKNSGLGFLTAMTDCAVSKGGKWYYEATLTSQGLMQIGWCDSDAKWNEGLPPARQTMTIPPPLTTDLASPSPPAGGGTVVGVGMQYKGVGDTDTSFAIDLFRRVLWSGGEATPLGASRRWVAGDVVGCALDLSSKEATFSLNGRPLAQITVRSSLPLSPAFSLRSGNGCILNFGTTPFKFKPEGFAALGVPDTWVERIDTYYSTVTPATGVRRLHRLERSGLLVGMFTGAVAAGGGGGSVAVAPASAASPQLDVGSSPDPMKGYQQSASALSPFVTPSKPPSNMSATLLPPSPGGTASTTSTAAAASSSSRPSFKVYSTFVAALNEYCQEKDKEESKLSVEVIIAAVLEKVPSLKHYDCAKILGDLRHFARIAKVAIPLIPYDGKGFDSVSTLLTSNRALLFAQMREQLFNTMLKETNSRAEHFRLTINRNHAKAAAFRNATATGASTSHLPRPPLSTTVFGQTVMLLGEQHPRIFKTSKRFWTTSFAGEGAEDAGGPFRAHINDICSELMSNALPLFVPTANNVHNVGEFREAFVPAAGAVGLKNATLFRFVGRLMGGCIRNGEPMGVYFPPIFWKKLARAGPITLADVAGMDRVCVQCVNEFATMRSQYGEDVAKEVFNDTFATETFMTRLSDGTAFDLIPNGSAISVTFDRCEEYAMGIATARLHEFDKQVEWIREGLLSVVPDMCLALLAPHELEMRVCGKADYTVKELRDGATFEGVSSEDKRVQFMWSALETATPKQRRLFLKFVSGRERMPVKLRVLPLVTSQNPDAVLPRAATCFFAIELPDYSCAEVMRAKLIYSIENCAEIDTDFRARDLDGEDGPQLHIGSEDRAEEDPNTAQE